MPPRIAGNIVTTQWLLPSFGDAQTPALNFGARNGVSRGSANIINVHVGGTTPVTATATGLTTTTTTVATRFVGDGSGLTNIVRTVAISTVQIVDSSNVLQDDMALDSATGGYVRITGTGFGGGSVVAIGNVLAMSTTVLSSTQLFATVSPQTAGTYAVTVTRADGVYATKSLAVTFSPFPAWSTSGILSGVVKGVSFSQTLAATEATGANITYTVADASDLPATVTLASNGILSGSVTSDTSNSTTYSFAVQATDDQFQNIPRTFSLFAIASPTGQALFTTTGVATWTAPANVFTVCAVCIGGGGGPSDTRSAGGGGLGWKNAIPVTPGQVYTLSVGAGGAVASNGTSGNVSYFISQATVAGLGGSANITGGGYVGDGGGFGGNGNTQTFSFVGGGGAGGYTGNGGNGGSGNAAGAASAGGAGQGGGGGGGAGDNYRGGGGVGAFGQGASGAGGNTATNTGHGQGGSGGITAPGAAGGLYGGGGTYTGAGAAGAVRLMWGYGRAYPSTNTANIP